MSDAQIRSPEPVRAVSPIKGFAEKLVKQTDYDVEDWARMTTHEFQEIREKDKIALEAATKAAEQQNTVVESGKLGPLLPYVNLAKARASETYAIALNRVEVTKVTVVGKIDQVQIKVFGYVASSDPKVQVTAASATGGAVVLGAGGAATGFGVGGVVGAAAGVIPAIFTFGLSIPIGATIGSCVGLCIGTPIGGSVGFVGAGATGYGVYKHRAEINNGLDCVQTKALTTYDAVKSRADSLKLTVKSRAIETYESAEAKAAATTRIAKTKTSEIGAGIRETVSDRKVQVTAASATGGAVIGGASGGAIGLAAGGTVGAALGLIPAIFTFGLSIPLGAAIGGGAGLCVGTASGGTVGLVGGGATGYGVYTHKQELRDGANGAMTKANDCAEYVKEKAQTSASYMKAKLSGGTGGTR